MHLSIPSLIPLPGANGASDGDLSNQIGRYFDMTKDAMLSQCYKLRDYKNLSDLARYTYKNEISI